MSAKRDTPIVIAFHISLALQSNKVWSGNTLQIAAKPANRSSKVEQLPAPLSGWRVAALEKDQFWPELPVSHIKRRFHKKIFWTVRPLLR
jgi:uncharacterized protein YfaP (DUF2135 family)